MTLGWIEEANYKFEIVLAFVDSAAGAREGMERQRLRGYCVIIALLALPAPVLSNLSHLRQFHSNGIPHIHRTWDFVLNLVRTDFHNFHLNLVHCRQGVDNVILDHLLREGNPVSVIETTKPGVHHFHETPRQHSTNYEMSIYFVKPSSHLHLHRLPKSLRSHLTFSIILNWDQLMAKEKQSLLWHAELRELKFKVELISTKHFVMLQSLCFYCNTDAFTTH